MAQKGNKEVQWQLENQINLENEKEKTDEVRIGINIYSAVIHPGARESSKGT